MVKFFFYILLTCFYKVKSLFLIFTIIYMAQEMHKRYSAITKEMDKVVIERDFLESGIEKVIFKFIVI